MENKICVIKNRSAGRVGYTVTEGNIRREFAPGEVKKIPYRELEQLSYQAGGRELMAQFLQILDIEVTQNLGIHTEPEYVMSEQQIIDLLRTGSVDAFLDCLDFAPIGVIELVKKYAVSLPLENYEKREALKRKTGFDVDKVIANLKAEKAEEAPEAVSTARRSTPETITPGRRTSGESYKIISIQE